MLPRRRLFLVAMGLLAILFAAGAWYMCTHGFTRRWRTYLVSQFEKQGIEVSLRRLTLDPFRGLVAQEVRLYDARDHRRVLAEINEMLLGVNYAGASRNENFVDWIDLRDAHLSLPIDSRDPDGAKIEIMKLNARLFLPREQIYLARGEAEIFGLRILATGRLINPHAFVSKHGRDRTALAAVASFLQELKQVRFEDRLPVLSLQVSGDLAAPEEISISGELHAAKIVKHNYSLQNVSAAASLRAGVLELQRLEATEAAGAHGDFHAFGRYDFRADKLSAHLRSSLSLQDLLPAYDAPWKLDDLMIYSAPRVELEAKGALLQPDHLWIIGHVGLGRFAYHGTVYKSLWTDLSWNGNSWSLRDLTLSHRSGELRGDAMQLPQQFRAHFEGSIHPHAFASILAKPVRDWLGRFDFVDAPSLTLDLHGTSPTLSGLAADGEVKFARANFDNQPASDFAARLQCADSRLTLQPFGPAGEDGSSREMICDFAHREVRIESHALPAPPQKPADSIAPPAPDTAD